MEHTQIAVLMTCYNRRNKTIKCLSNLMSQNLPCSRKIELYIVDADSSDGTFEAIKERFPEANLIRCENNTFWCGGMRIAFQEASKHDYDYYLWLNDDTMLNPNALETLIKISEGVSQKQSQGNIIVGSLCDPDSGDHAYGGVVRISKLRPILFKPVKPSNVPQECDTMNGNCVLLSKKSVALVGNLSEDFTHAMGDNDYGLRAKAKGVLIWVAPGYVGACTRNPLPLWQDPKATLVERLKHLHSPKGVPPCEWFIFAKRHAPLYWPIHMLSLYLRVVFPRLWH